MNKVLIFILTLLFVEQVQAQSIIDSVLYDVILINEKDVTTDGTDFLIDIPIKPKKEPIVIFNNDRCIPLILFLERKSFLSEQDEIILITPDWKYYEGIRESEKRMPGLRLDPYRQNKFYHIRRTDSHYAVDSISRAIEYQPFTINYKKTGIQENEVSFPINRYDSRNDLDSSPKIYLPNTIIKK